MNNPNTFEAVMAVYGVPDQNDNILTERAALDLFDKLSQQAERHEQMRGNGYHLISARIEGDREHGKVYATFQKQEEQQ